MTARPLPRRILVICLRRLGDVLLATPLMRSLRRAYPEAVIEALIFASTTSVLEGNPDVDRVIAWPARASLREGWRRARPLFRRYDLAFAVTASDRAQLLAAWAARYRVVTVQRNFARPWLNRQRVEYDPGRLHTVSQGLRLVQTLDLVAVPEVVPPQAGDTAGLDALLGPGWQHARYAVVHPAPMFRYKAWTLDGWRALITALQARGLLVLLSGGPGAEDRGLTSALAAGPTATPTSADVSARHEAAALPDQAVINLAGQLSLAALSGVLEHAAVFIGPDTSITHLAAACGTPTVALFGPSSPVAWGPWPQGWNGAGDSPWQLVGAHQRVGSVVILQGTQGRFGACIPCLQEGCERHQGSVSDCLVTLPLARVLDAVDQLLLPTSPGSRAPA